MRKLKDTNTLDSISLGAGIFCVGKLGILEKIRDQIKAGLTVSDFDRRYCNYGCDLAFYTILPSLLLILTYNKKRETISEKKAVMAAYATNALVFVLNDGFGLYNHNSTTSLDRTDFKMCVLGTIISLIGYGVDRNIHK